MSQRKLEVADIFRRHGEAWRIANAGHVSLGQLRVMSAIEVCRTAALGGHVERCADCAHMRISYNSCRNRHCPKCQWSAAAEWLAAREAEVLPVPYFHVVFTLPAKIRPLAYQNKATVYGLLFKAAAETLTVIAADPEHLGAEIGFITVLHTWGQNLDHHPHVHCIVPGGGVSLDGKRWIGCSPKYFLPVEVLSCLFRRLFLQGLHRAFNAGELQFFSQLAPLKERKAFNSYLAPLRDINWVVYTKRTFGGPKQVLGYLARYTHRVAIANSRLVSLSDGKVRFRWKDYRDGDKSKVMTLEAGEFIRRFLLHTLPDGFHRIRYYGLLANGHRADKVKFCRTIIGEATPQITAAANAPEPTIDATKLRQTCPCCGGRMMIIEAFDGPYSSTCGSGQLRRLDTS
jgi:hypothetical protein